MRRFLVVTFPHPHSSRVGTLEDEDETHLLLTLDADWYFSKQLVCIPKWDLTELK